jgi:uncharacterized iron-regulated membrane protein
MPQLLFVHRWIGVVLALFMLLWFASGLVIANTGSLAVSRERQLAHANILAPEAGWLSLSEAQSQSPPAPDGVEGGDAKGQGPSAIAEARLTRRAGEPFWLIETSNGQRKALSALDGGPKRFSPEDALRIAHDWLAVESADHAVSYLDTVDTAPGLRNAEGLKPFHRIRVIDGDETIIIISAQTGDVLQAAPRLARAMNYAGNWLHLFRPFDLFGAGDYRRDALTYAGFFAFTGALTGIVIGFIKWRPGFFDRPTYSGGRTQPYREVWLKYHFWAGLIGGVFALIWAGSGFLSTNPRNIFSPAAPGREELARYRGSRSLAVIEDWRPAQAASLAPGAVELVWSRIGDAAVLLSFGRDGVRTPLQPPGAVARFEDATLVGAAERLNAEAAVATTERISEYDSYYFTTHGQSGSDRPLPVLRVDFADAGKTSVYLDPQDGRLLLRIDDSRRAFRWLYSAVHHWDFGWFRRHPVARRIWIVTWAALGLVLAVSAVVLAWRRLRRTMPARSPQAQKAPSTARA